MHVHEKKLKIIVGLGNPGAEYARTRHNFGFLLADNVAQRLAEQAHDPTPTWRLHKKFQAEIAEFNMDGEKIMLAKPQTFYNLVGDSVRAIRDFYKLANNDILVIHDELALPLGTVRTRIGGADAGNNGIKNLIAQLGPDFARVRVGSGTPQGHDGATKPPSDQHTDIVLGRLSADETKILTQLAPRIYDIATDFARGKFAPTTIKTQSVDDA